MNQPQFQALPSYENLDMIRKTFPPLEHINFDHEFKNLEKSKYFIIRTQGEDNVHRAMKYGIWTSSSRKNERLNEAFSQGDVYLFFTEINSLCFSGMAKLTSGFDPKQHFKYWLIENKWFGLFQIKWLYVKDLPFKLFENIKQIQKFEGSDETIKSVYDLIDCTELTLENGIKMVEIFKKEESKKSLFEDFSQLDKLENQSRQQRDTNPNFEKKFQELRSVFETIPYSFSAASYERRQQRKPQYGYYNYGYYQQPQYWQSNSGFYQQEQYQQYPYQQYQNKYQDSTDQKYNNKKEIQQPVNLEDKFEMQQNRKYKYDKKKRFNNRNNQQIEYVQKYQQETIVQQNI
ncbi:unnamed protein product [Paramecium primaurelia]|uniref:YTH domain-containing protein n=1 Tax=Paramecium primaurelia TaxID=5886 RepID=A0A8S1NXU3_PARPR|nr:unnamed protein product [Paramecium primaurelia]